MATPKSSQDDNASSYADDHSSNAAPSGAPPTFASFSPVTLSSTTPSRSSRPSTILVHQKSPLLLATPPQITRALAYSHPFLLPLNKAVGLLSWTSGDPWESFLLVCTFWAVVLYGDVVVRITGPIVLVLGLILAMYSRRYSPLSSTGWTDAPAKDADPSQSHHGGAGHARSHSEATSTRHHKTLDEMVDTLKEFTGRCNVLLGPALELTDFLSTQRTPTSATTRPALTALFIRILFCTPFWYALTLPPLRIITTRRIILLFGTLVLTWHARVIRVARAILWRSATVRRTVALVTGLHLEDPPKSGQPPVPETVVTAAADGPVPKPTRQPTSELTRALKRRNNRGGGRDAGVKFTFIIYENQRRWVGLGWTQSLFAYERAAWTDEHNNPVPPKGEFELPEVEEESSVQWRWVDGSRWKVDGVSEDGKETDYDGEAGKNGWIYYDNKVRHLLPKPPRGLQGISSSSISLPTETLTRQKWQNGKRGMDGWGRWTRRRKWYRDAELVEVSEDERRPTTASSSTPQLTTERYSTLSEKMVTPQASPSMPSFALDGSSLPAREEAAASSTSAPSSSSARSFFRKPLMRRGTNQSTATTASSVAAVEGKGRDRRSSEAAQSRDGDAEEGEEDVDALGLRVNLALQGQGNGNRWGIGDEARMSLE